MRVWIDLANSPHVPLLEPVVAARCERTGTRCSLTARDHAQTLELARAAWPDVRVIGGESPPGRLAKGVAIVGRGRSALRRFARGERPDVAFSHGSYAQVVAARLARVPAVTMMDYEHQPANHLSFRLARRGDRPARLSRTARPEAASARERRSSATTGSRRSCTSAASGRTRRARRARARSAPRDRRLPAAARGRALPPLVNDRFDALLDARRSADGVQVVLLPRTDGSRPRVSARSSGVQIPERAGRRLARCSRSPTS